MKLFQAYLLLIFLSLAATSIANEKYAKTGCNDTCGTVTIPYPFGIGAGCSINQWYIVDCNSPIAYLPALNNLEVLRVNLENQTVVVSTRTPRISDCQNPVPNSSQIMSIDLSTTPFLFCSYHNIFVFDGCGNAVMMENGSELTGCSTFCLNKTVGERRNCLGFSCCQTTIPHYLDSYSINLRGLSVDGGCGYAFLVDRNWYVRGNVSFATNSASVPVSLMWILPHGTTLNCCRGAADPINLELNTGNGTSVESRICVLHMGYKGNPYLFDGCDGIRHLGVSISMGVFFMVATSYVLYKWIKRTKERRQKKRFFKRNGGLLLKTTRRK